MDGHTQREREINNALVNFQNPHEREREFKILNDRFFQFTRIKKKDIKYTIRVPGHDAERRLPRRRSGPNVVVNIVPLHVEKVSALLLYQ